MSLIDDLEGSHLCDYAALNNVNLPSDQQVTSAFCYKYDSGIMKTGLSNIYQSAYKTANQLRLEIEANRSPADIAMLPDSWFASRINQMIPYLDMIELLVLQPINLL